MRPSNRRHTRTPLLRFCEERIRLGQALFSVPAEWIGKKGGLFSGEALGPSKEKPGLTSRASQSTKQEEVRPHAHSVAENRDAVHHGEDEAIDP